MSFRGGSLFCDNVGTVLAAEPITVMAAPVNKLGSSLIIVMSH